MMEHDTEIFKRIQILRDMGIGLSVDDFGTGFSGLSRLVSLPVTEIKIDKSFVDRCLTEKRILALLEAITSIGQSLNLTVVAEGVETKEQFEMLRKIHCRVIQGYFFFPPPARRRNSRLDEQRVTAENLINSSRPHSRVFI